MLINDDEVTERKDRKMNELTNKQHGLYKFVTNDTKEIIYIGKSDNDIIGRRRAHIRGKGLDEKFVPYRGKYIGVCMFL